MNFSVREITSDTFLASFRRQALERRQVPMILVHQIHCSFYPYSCSARFIPSAPFGSAPLPGTTGTPLLLYGPAKHENSGAAEGRGAKHGSFFMRKSWEEAGTKKEKLGGKRSLLSSRNASFAGVLRCLFPLDALQHFPLCVDFSSWFSALYGDTSTPRTPTLEPSLSHEESRSCPQLLDSDLVCFICFFFHSLPPLLPSLRHTLPSALLSRRSPHRPPPSGSPILLPTSPHQPIARHALQVLPGFGFPPCGRRFCHSPRRNTEDGAREAGSGARRERDGDQDVQEGWHLCVDV